eukprot:gene12309-14538_t
MRDKSHIWNIANKKRKTYINKINGLIQKTNAKVFIPYACYFVEAHPTDSDIRELNTKNTLNDVITCVNQDVWVPFPNGIFDMFDMKGEYPKYAFEHYYRTDWNFDYYLKDYDKYANYSISNNHEFYSEYFKWAGFKSYDLILHIIETSDDFSLELNQIIFDFKSNKIIKYRHKNRNYMRVRIRQSHLRKVMIEGEAWEGIYGAFGGRFYVEPDIYHYKFLSHFNW